MVQKESLIGMVMHNGNLCRMTQHADGSTTCTPHVDGSTTCTPEEEKSITERFKDTKTVPSNWDNYESETHKIQDWNPETDTTLVQLSVPHTRDEHIRISIKVEALLTMIFDGTAVNTKGNKQFRAVLESLCNIMGNEWKEHIKTIL